MGVLGPELRARISDASGSDRYEVHIFGKGAPTAAVFATALTDAPPPDRAEVVALIRNQSKAQLAPLLGFLSGEAGGVTASLIDSAEPPTPRVAIHKQFWINNSIRATVTLDVLRELEARADVSLVDVVHHATHEELIDGLTEPLTAAPAGPTWSVKKINAPALWDKGINGEGVVVAVIDTGVNYNHPDLAGRMWDAAGYAHHGWNFFDDDDDPQDVLGHGTACAGIVAGNGASGTETGVAPGAKVMALRAGETESSFWDALEFALENHADVISMSMTWKYDKSPDQPGWRRVCESILAAGVLHANSSGNQGAQLNSYPVPWNVGAPGNCPSPRTGDPARRGASPITCGSTDDEDRIALTSGQGPSQWNDQVFNDWPYPTGLTKPDVCAPGESTLSLNYRIGDANATPYARFTGTSAATPNVAGALALLVHACKRAGTSPVPANVQEALEATAVRIEGQTDAKENRYGAGRIDVAAAWQYGVDRGWWS